MIVRLFFGGFTGKTHIKFRSLTDYEHYIKSIDQGYDSEDAILSGYLYILNTPQFTLVHRSRHGNGCDFKHEFNEFRGNNCFIPRKGYCLIKRIKFLIGKGYKEEYLEFIRNERRRCIIMNMARIEPFGKANNFNLG